MTWKARLERKLGAALICALWCAGSFLLWAADSPGDIDWNRARQLYQRAQAGETLTADEQAYLERAREARLNGNGSGATVRTNQSSPAQAENPDIRRARALLEKGNRGEPLTEEEKAFVERIRQQIQGRTPAGAVAEGRRSIGVLPLSDMGALDRYKGEDGGLYGRGQNVPPATLQKAAAAESAKIGPLDAAGKPSSEGKIGLLSIGMSNTTQEYSKFKQLADADPDKAANVVIVDGAQGGQDAARWDDEQSGTWRIVGQRLHAAGLTAQQVQVVWMKHARSNPARYGEYPKHAEELAAHIVGSIRLAKQRFPNLRIVYLSSRIYAGYAVTALNPEPYAFESALAVRRVILDQLKADCRRGDGFSPGQVLEPLLLWGPYLWADGLTPRKSDGLVWQRQDLAGDGTHPSQTTGREKVARLLLNFFKTDPYAQAWFLQAATSHPPRL